MAKLIQFSNARMKMRERIITINLVLLFLIFVNTAHSQADSLITGVKTVVIDPGHGGKDPGCHGKNTKEKDVALSIGLALGKYIETTYPEIKVIYTRDTDVFVELDERAKIANRNDADLFICIHANAGPSAAHGAETYVLGLHRTESQRRIAERENSDYRTLSGILIGFGFLLVIISFGTRRKRKGGAKKIEKKPLE